MAVDFEIIKTFTRVDNILKGENPTIYKEAIVGLIFLKYVTNSFEEKYNELITEVEGFEEDRDAYLVENISFVPANARWEFIKKSAKLSTIGQVIDDAMLAIEAENWQLRNVFPRNYNVPWLDEKKLGELIILLSCDLGSEDSKGQDPWIIIFEYFLENFCLSRDEFHTPPTISKLLVCMIEPYEGRVYDPRCGIGGMFVQSAKFVEENQGRRNDIHIYGQEINKATWRFCKMNLVIHGIDSYSDVHNASALTNELHDDLRADYILSNPAFSISNYALIQDDIRWKYGTPPAGNANYAWIQHIISKLSSIGVAGFVLINNALWSSNKFEAEIRKNIIEAGLVDCIVLMPPNFFRNTSIPVCLWIISKNRENRNDKILFIDAQKMGYMATSKYREMNEEEIKQIYDKYHKWRDGTNEYHDVPGFCKSVNIEEIREHKYTLNTKNYIDDKIGNS